MNQKPFTENQYQRCLIKAREMSDAIYDMRVQPMSAATIDKLIKSQIEFEQVITDVVNESCN